MRIHLKSQVQKLILEEGRITGISLTDGSVHRAEAVIVLQEAFPILQPALQETDIALPGRAGHTVTDLSPSLVPLHTKEDIFRNGRSFSEKRRAHSEKRKKSPLPGFWGDDVYSFRNYGTSGSFCQRQTGTALRKSGELSAFLDLKPALTPEQLDARILREFESGKNKQFKNVISVLFPSSLTPVMLKIGGISPENPFMRFPERNASGSALL